MNLVTASELRPGDKCVQWEVPWTELESLVCDGVGESSVTFTVLRSGTNSVGKRISLSPDVSVFKSPYTFLEGPDAKANVIRKEALKIRHITSNFISNAEGHALLNDLLVRLRSFFPEDRMKFVVGCLKCSVAIQLMNLSQHRVPASLQLAGH